ncbi:MAG: small-conductance mechanosensitive channel [Alteromonas naphthalenivorans]|jgi:small-conductance mechanosensitive channel
MNVKKVISLSLLLLIGTSLRADLLSSFGLKKEGSLDLITGEDKTERELKQLRKEVDSVEIESKTFEDDIQQKIDSIRKKIKHVDEQLSVATDDTYFNKQLFTLKSTAQILASIRSSKKAWIGNLKSRITLLTNLEEDKNVEHDEKKALYTFEELQTLNRKIANQEDKISHIDGERSEVNLDLDNAKRQLETTEKAYKEKLKEQGEFGNEVLPSDQYAREKSSLLDFEVKMAQYQKELADIQVKEKSAKLALVEEKESVEQKNLNASRAQKDFIVRMSLRVDKKDIAVITDKIKVQKREYLNKTDKYLHEIEKLSTAEEKLKKELLELEVKYPDKEYGITNLNEWITVPSSASSFLALAERGLKNDEVRLIEVKIDFNKSQNVLEKVLFQEHENALRIVESWYKIKHQHFKSSDQLSTEISGYQASVAEMLRERSIYEDKRVSATNRLSLQNKALTNVKNHQATLKQKRNQLFKGEESKFNKSDLYLSRAQTIVSKQVEYTGRLIEAYSKILVSVGGEIKEVKSMVAELQRVSLWHRSGGAISKEGLGNIIPDVSSFFVDVRTLGASYLSGFKLYIMSRKLLMLLQNPLSLIILLWKLFLIFLFFFLLQRYLPTLSRFFIDVGSEYRGAFVFSRILALCIEFISKHLITLYIWFFLFFSIGVSAVTEIYPAVVFFLVSIPYLLYISNRFIHFIIQFNKDHESELFPEHFVARLSIVGSIFLYTSISILFFREAFILATYTKSELPSVLLALYSIIVRILLLSLIRKEDLLSVIPSRSDIGGFFWRLVDQYYHTLLIVIITVMILSDPHIGGYDNLVAYFFWGLFGTLLVGRLLMLSYGFCRRISSYIFFSSDGETLNQRFESSKTLYGLTVVFLFIFFSLFGIWCIAWFWGNSIPLNSVGSFFSEKRYAIGVLDGKYHSVSVFDLIRTFLFIPFAFMVGHLVDRFILDRIFSVLLVDPGVHNAVSTILYYLVVILVITIGLVHEGFGFLVMYYMLPLLVGMGFALREVFNDFIAYFVLLVQRPLKIGDYIKISDEVSGVVRKITPRAVILRRKRSFHLVVPNSKLMQEVIMNWDYTSGFITFPDIIVGIRYAADPVKTKEVLMQAVMNVNNVLKTPPPIIRLEEFGPSGYIFMVRGYVSSEMTLQQWIIASDVRLSIVKYLHDNHIEIAFPVRVIRMMGESKNHQYLDPSGRPVPGEKASTEDDEQNLPGEEFPEV